MLTVSALRSILTAGLGLEAAGVVDALAKRGMLPDDEPLSLRSIAIAALALVCGEEPAKAPSAALRLAEYRLSGHAERCDQPGGAAMVWQNFPEVGGTLADALVGLMSAPYPVAPLPYQLRY